MPLTLNSDGTISSLPNHEDITVDSSGNVSITGNTGIGTSAGSKKLTVYGTTQLTTTSGTTTDEQAALEILANSNRIVTNSDGILDNMTVYINGNTSGGSDCIRIGPMNTLGDYYLDVSNYNATADYDLIVNPYAGSLLAPNQPSFFAYKSGHWTEQTGNVTGWTEELDIRSGLNASTGLFTAPVAGKYFFALSAMTYNLTGDTQYRWYKNGSYYAGSNQTDHSAALRQVTVTCVAYLAEGDTMSPYTYSSTTSSGIMFYSGRYSHICGHLIG